jgi:hypothetical protein
MGSPLDHSHLQALDIDHTTWTVRLTASGQWRGLLQDPTALTTLKLSSVSIYGWREAAAQLTSVKHLEIYTAQSKDPDDPHIPGKHLGFLQQLTCLDLIGQGTVTAAALQPLSRLPNLQELCLGFATWAEEDGDQIILAAVNSSTSHLQCLTSLDIMHLAPAPCGISKITSLQHL